MPCTEAYKEHIMYTFHGFCKIVIRNAAITAWRDQHRRHKREISLEYLTEEKFYPLGTTDEYFEIPHYDMWSDSYPHQWGACRRRVISAGEEPGNHFPLLFRALHTAGNRGNVRTLPEYGMASHTQCLANVT